jgi:hypothetical protein
MINPFDNTAMKFFIGFILILLASFALLYISNTYSGNTNIEAAASLVK